MTGLRVGERTQQSNHRGRCSAFTLKIGIPVVRTPSFHCKGHEFDPWSGDMKCSLGISDFLEEISSLSHSVVFLYFFELIAEWERKGHPLQYSGLENSMDRRAWRATIHPKNNKKR